jgi:hypothetical protein
MSNPSPTQSEAILARLQRGPLTALEALAELQCFRLAARICDLRAEGHDIRTDNVRLANGKSVARYSLHTPTTERKAA